MSQARSSGLSSSARLNTLRRLGLLDSPIEPAFDRLTQLAARILKAPVALVSLVDQDRQFFKSSVGLSEPWATRRETPLSHSFCQHVVDSGQKLIIADARVHPRLQSNLAIRDLEIIAYAGIPLVTRDGYVLGSFCAIDSTPRVWTADEIATLEDLAAAVMTEIELRAEMVERAQAEATARELADQRRRLLEVAQTVMSSLTLDQLLPRLHHMFQTVLAHNALSIYWLDEAAGLLRPAHIAAPAWMDDQVMAWSIPLGSGIAGAIGQTGRAELVNDAHLDPRSIYPPETLRPDVHHLIGVPIFAKDHLRGVCLMSRDNGQPFTTQDFDLAQLFISFVSLAIENAHLFEQSRVAEEHFAKAFHASPGAITITSLASGRFLDVNDAFLALMGYRREEVIGRTTAELGTWMIPEQRAAVAQALGQQQSVRSQEITFRTKSGSALQTLASMEMIELNGERCILSLTQDITERNRAEAALRESEERFKAIYEHAPVMIDAFTDDGRCILWNKECEKQFGYTSAELRACADPLKLFYPDPEIRAAILQLITKPDGIFRECQAHIKDGSVRDQMWANFALPNNMIIGVGFDITERRRAEQEQQRLIHELHEALVNVKTLRGLLPICASCKKIRDDQGYWNQLEFYIKTHSEADFTHGICPDCAQQLYGDLYNN